MGRVSARIAKEMRQQWALDLAGGRIAQTHEMVEVIGRGVDYEGADSRWVCNRKKAYGSRTLADRVAARLNAANNTDDARPGFRGVQVVAYLCRRCGEFHIGR